MNRNVPPAIGSCALPRGRTVVASMLASVAVFASVQEEAQAQKALPRPPRPLTPANSPAPASTDSTPPPAPPVNAGGAAGSANGGAGAGGAAAGASREAPLTLPNGKKIGDTTGLTQFENGVEFQPRNPEYKVAFSLETPTSASSCGSSRSSPASASSSAARSATSRRRSTRLRR